MSARLSHFLVFLKALNQRIERYLRSNVVFAQRWCSPTTSTLVQKPCTADTSTTQQQIRTLLRGSGVSCCFPLFLLYIEIDLAPLRLSATRPYFLRLLKTLQV